MIVHDIILVLHLQDLTHNIGIFKRTQSTSNVTDSIFGTITTIMIPHSMIIAFLLLVLFPTEIVGQSCIDDISEIYEKEELYSDTTFPRLYVICPRRIYDMGHLDFNGNVIESDTGSVVPPIPLRANMTIRCGDQGSRDNLCWFTGGDLHMDGTSVLGIKDDTVENVKIEGFVFIGSRQHSLWANKPGSITFKDCEFRDFVNSQVPIMLDYYDSTSSTELVVSFIDCEFRDNRYFGMGSHHSLIYGNSAQNRLIIESSLFENNDMIWNNTRPDSHSFLIESLGPVELKTTCFQDNAVGSSDVVVFGNTFQNEFNFITNSSGQLCPFSSVFETIEQFDSFTPKCIDASESFCNWYATDMPTRSPTTSPSSEPTGAPSAKPTVSLAPSSRPSTSPTITARPTITALPSEQPSAVHSEGPTVFGATRSPTTSPTEPPVPIFVWPTTDMPISSGTCTTYTRINSKVWFFFGASIYFVIS